MLGESQRAEHELEHNIPNWVYDKSKCNCEHFARYCCTGEKRSHQIETLKGDAKSAVVSGVTAAAGGAWAYAVGTICYIGAITSTGGIAGVCLGVGFGIQLCRRVARME